MASSKHQKSTPVRSNTYLPKAGPKSMHGGKKIARGIAKNNEPSLFERMQADRRVAAQEQVQQKRIANAEQKKKRLLAERIKQATLATQLLSELKCDEEARHIVELVINEFTTIEPNDGDVFKDSEGRKCSRTSFAEQIVFRDIDTSNIKLVGTIRWASRKCLRDAFDQIKSEKSSQRTARELVTA